MFLDETALSQYEPLEFNLLDVQAVVFYHFEDLRSKLKEEESKVENLPSDEDDHDSAGSKTLNCVCVFKPQVSLTSKDLNHYTHLLSTVDDVQNEPSKALNAKEKRKKKNAAHNLKVAHAKVTQAQLSIQTQLLACKPCAHKCLSTGSEHIIHQFIVGKQEHVVASVPRYYKLLHRISVQASKEQSTFIKKQQPSVAQVIIPPHDSFKLDGLPKLVDAEAKFLEQYSFPKTDESESTGTVIIPSAVLSLLFEHASLGGVYIPFSVNTSKSGGPSGNCPSLEFHGTVRSQPLSPRERARTYYQLCLESSCITNLPLPPGSTRMEEPNMPATPSRKSSTASSVSGIVTPRRSLRSKRTPQGQTESVEKFDGNTYHEVPSKRQCRQYTSDQRSPARSTSSAPRTRSNRATSISSAAATDEDTDDLGNLSIDVESSDSSSKLTVSDRIMQEIATICTVVTKTSQSEGSLVDKPSAPASPPSEAPASPDTSDQTMTAPSSVTELRVIPLEPVSHEIDQPTDQTPSTTQSNSSTRYSWTTFQLGKVHVHVPVETVSWSLDKSCMVCSQKKAGCCPLWPSCSSRPTTPSQKLKPIYVQIKPEYLGTWGCEVLSSEELADAWLGSSLRGDADILRIRVRADSGEVVWAEYQSLQDLLAMHPNVKPDVNMGFLASLFEQLMKLPNGAYLLTQTEQEPSDSFQLYEALQSSGAHLPANELFDLQAVHQRFIDVSQSLVSASPVLGAALGPQTIQDVHHPWFTVACSRLDLDLPAGLESSSDGGRRGLCLPGLPIDRLPINSAHTSTPFTVSKQVSEVTTQNQQLTATTKAPIRSKQVRRSRKRKNT